MKSFTTLLITLLLFASIAVAQIKKEKVEIGVQSTSLTLFHPDFPFDSTQTGIGGRVTYNFNRAIAAESEVNFFPQKVSILTADGNAIQAQFGVKAGKRFEKFGLFGKLRPGFLSVNRVGSFVPGAAGSNNQLDFKIERKAFFTIDSGGVLELYPAKRTVVRFEAGDTVVRHPATFSQSFVGGPVVLIRPAKFNHNFQFTAGVAFRLGDFPDDEAKLKPSNGGQERVTRFEVGAQFTSLLVDPRNQFSLTIPRKNAEPGFGGRFTFNLSEAIAFEAEGNYFTRNQFNFLQGGHMFQGQFGAKVGKRFEKWGLFGKARPGFVGFSRVFETPGVLTSGSTFVRKLYPSLDLGGVVEFYASRRWMARFDIGDTLIRYGRLDSSLFLPPFGFQQQRTRHNLQLTTGIGFRF